MDETFDPITLLFLVLAVVIFLRLRSVLGKRTGHERQHYESTISRTEEKQTYQQDNVVQLPTGRENQDDDNSYQQMEEDISERIKGVCGKR